MSLQHSRRTSTKAVHMSWVSAAFIIESILLLVFLVGSLAILTQLFSASLNRSVEGRTLDAATIAATSIAEHFAADPTGVNEETQLGDLRIVCSVEGEQRAGGVLYHATIDVFDTSASGGNEPVYTLATASYEEGAV